MRSSLIPSALLILTASASALQLPSFQPFFAALPINLSDYISPTHQQQSIPPPQPYSPNPNNVPAELKKRQTTTTLASTACPTSFLSCANLGAPALCCAKNAVCSADFAGHVACCPSGAACSGTIGGVITGGTLSGGSLVGAAAATSSGTSAGGLVAASTASTATTTTSDGSGGGFVIASGSTVATPGGGIRGAQVVSLLLILPHRL